MTDEQAEHKRIASSNQSTFGSLTERERLELVDFVRQTHGPLLSRAAFGDALCLALEDVSGFENPNPDMLADLICAIWDGYRSTSTWLASSEARGQRNRNE